MGTFRARAVLLVIVACVCLATAGAVWATQTITANASFNPDKLGAATNFAVTAEFHSATGGVPSPTVKLTAYLPAGVRIDTKGASTCTALTLKSDGPFGCPANSRIGFGGGQGVLVLGKTFVREPFTVDLFLAPREGRRLAVLGFIQGRSPVSIELMMTGREILASKPYGVGFTFVVPPVTTLSGAPNVSIESAFVTIGDRNAAFFKDVNGKRVLTRLRGFVLPSSCPRGGFHSKVAVEFEDGSTAVAQPVVPCPGGQAR